MHLFSKILEDSNHTLYVLESPIKKQSQLLSSGGCTELKYPVLATMVLAATAIPKLRGLI
jgi:hypothetical protein